MQTGLRCIHHYEAIDGFSDDKKGWEHKYPSFKIEVSLNSRW